MSVRINGEELPEAAILTELQRLIQFYKDHLSKAEIGRRMPQLMRAARDQAIGARLLRDEAIALKVEVDEAEVEKSFQTMLKQAGNSINLKALAAKHGLTLETLRDSIRTGKRIDALVARVTAKAAAPGGDEIKAWHEAHPADYRMPDRALVRHINKVDAEVGRAMTLDEARDRIADLLLHQNRGQALAAYVQRLRAAVTIEEDDDAAAVGAENDK